MWTTSALPFALTCAGYLALSLSGPARLAAPDAAGQLDRFFILSGWTLLPAACIVVLSLFRVDVKQAMLWSILAGGAVCLTVQGMEPGELFACLAFGYTPAPGAEILAGGGIRSMLQVAGIVLLTSAYAGLLEATGLLDGLSSLCKRLSLRLGAFRTTVLAGLPVAAVSCNQTLGIMLTKQLCAPLGQNGKEMVLPLENGIVLLAAIIPWSIAGSVPCAIMGVGPECLPYTFYLYMVPLTDMLLRRR